MDVQAREMIKTSVL